MLNSIAALYGTGAAPAATTAYESIATVTVALGGASYAEFTSIPSTYTHLQVRGIASISSSVTTGKLQFNGDTATNYAYHKLIGNGSSTGAGNSTSQAFIGILDSIGFNSTANNYAAFVVDILNYANVNKYKTTRTLAGDDLNGSGGIELDSGLWQSTSAITSMRFTPYNGANWTQYSSFALYGVK